MLLPGKDSWPILRRYQRDHTQKIALPLGGIGTGTVSLGGRGDLRDWEIVNRPAKGFAPRNGFFAIRVAEPGKDPIAKALEGEIPEELYEGWSGSPVSNAGLPRFSDCSFEACYPFGRVVLSDPDVPLDVRLEAFNPLLPPDAEASGLPVAVLRFVLVNKTSTDVSATVCGSIQNFIGEDGSLGAPDRNRNVFREEGDLKGIYFDSEGVSTSAEQWGTMALTTTSRGRISYRTTWADLIWGDSLLDFWDDLLADGHLDERKSTVDAPTGSLAVSLVVSANGTTDVTFLLTWHFPNRLSWRAPARNPQTWDDNLRWIGNYYAQKFEDAWGAARNIAPRLTDLENGTKEFAGAVCDSDLPLSVREAALFNLSTLRTQTCFRTPDGYLFGWEGCQDKFGSCFGTCTHVWNYEQATAFLFGDLAKGMREVEFLHSVDERGLMSFRVNLPLDYGTEFGVAAADGQMGCIIKIYREWKLSGDQTFLTKLWPKVREAIEFCWIEGGWDADQDGVMEGCQHNTMDVEYYGPNPQMGFLYLGALRAAEEMALPVGEKEFATRCRALFENGSRLIDEKLFNGEYYEHLVEPPEGTKIAKGLRWNMGAQDLDNPELQLGAGCLVDQLFGQYLAHITGLGYLAKPENISRALAGVLKFNFKRSFKDHFNHMRSYVLNDESAILMASYPHGNRPARPFPYFNEVMTGFEYTAAVGMIYEGAVDDGLLCIEAIRTRYDGKRRSPFNEAECGHHYARAMASWAAILALTGFEYDGVNARVKFAPATKPSVQFWSNGSAWGIIRQKPQGDTISCELAVGNGTLKVQTLTLTGWGSTKLEAPQNATGGEVVSFSVRREY
jgi:non-lysosomal glucosylceramidase